MSERIKRTTGRIILPEVVVDDRNIIQLLREERIVVHFHNNERMNDMFVKAPNEDGIIHEFPVLRGHDTEGWQRTSIDSFTLKRALQQHVFRLENESDTPFSDINEK